MRGEGWGLTDKRTCRTRKVSRGAGRETRLRDLPRLYIPMSPVMLKRQGTDAKYTECHMLSSRPPVQQSLAL